MIGYNVIAFTFRDGAQARLFAEGAREEGRHAHRSGRVVGIKTDATMGQIEVFGRALANEYPGQVRIAATL